MDKQFGSIDNRLVLLEEKLEFQEYTIEKLNDVIISQQLQIDRLEDNLRRLRERVETGQIEPGDTIEEPLPPHY